MAKLRNQQARFGVENDQSVLEWNKHLSIVGRLDVDPKGKQQPDMLYSTEPQHPVHKKAIREFKTRIDAELSTVRIELDAQHRQLPAAVQPCYSLHLPSKVRLDIRPARDPLTDIRLPGPAITARPGRDPATVDGRVALPRPRLCIRVLDLRQILPKLFVGSYPGVADIDTLKESGITAVLNVQSDEDFAYHGVNWPDMRARYFAVRIEVRRVPILDFNDDDLRDQLPLAVQTLSQLLDDGDTVFVHCNAGVNRSPSVVICYLNWMLEWDLDHAEQHVQKCHPCAPVMEVVRLATRDSGREMP